MIQLSAIHSTFSWPPGAGAQTTTEEEGSAPITTTTTTLSPEEQAEQNRQSRQRLIIYRSLPTWQHVSRALVTQTPLPPNQKFAYKILEVLADADKLAVRYLPHKALQSEEARKCWTKKQPWKN